MLVISVTQEAKGTRELITMSLETFILMLLQYDASSTLLQHVRNCFDSTKDGTSFRSQFDLAGLKPCLALCLRFHHVVPKCITKLLQKSIVAHVCCEFLARASQLVSIKATGSLFE